MKNKIAASLILLCLVSAAAFAQTKEKYISPNNDGVQDELVIPLRISDQRFVASWALVIMDEDRNPVRTIGNKIALPEKIGFKSFFKQLVSVKKGIQIPDTVSWNGALDSGETAPDGNYYYYFTASDDNGNEGRTKEYKVVVDTSAPEVEVTQPVDKIFGEGEKSTFRISQNGSVEDSWFGIFKSSKGDVVKTVTWESAEPADFVWYGTDDSGSQIPDGVYSYEITATDRAGNKAPYTTIQNIIYSADKPVTNIFVDGSRYFSPETESKKSSVSFKVNIPVPDEKTGNKLTAWSVSILNEKDEPVRSYSNEKDGEIPPDTIVFDGKGDNGKLLPDGNYQARVEAAYLNGYVPAMVTSPVIILDTKKPEVNLSLTDKAFGSANVPSIGIMIASAAKENAPVLNWKGKIVSEDGTTVKEYNFLDYLPSNVSWNGVGNDGRFAAFKKDYTFVLTATDLAGNACKITSESFLFDQTEAKILLAVNDNAFSPNGDKVKDKISFTCVIEEPKVANYHFAVNDVSGKTVYEVNGGRKDGKTVDSPDSFEWNGKDSTGIICEDGEYFATVKIELENHSEASSSTSKFVLDTTAPVMTAECQWTDFSPDGDGNQDVIPVTVTACSEERTWNAAVLNAEKVAVKKFSWYGKIKDFDWDGTDESGNLCADGKYVISFNSTDDAGNSFSAELPGITLDNRETKLYVTTEKEGISPNGDGILDTEVFDIKTSVAENIVSWKFDIRKEDGNSVRSWSEKDSANLPARITWDGFDSDGNICEGTFTGTLAVAYKKGNHVSTVSTPFICTATPPALEVRTASSSGSEYFSPDNDGVDDDLFIRLSGTTKAKIQNWSFTIDDPKGKPFWTTSGKSQITERIVWDGLSNLQKNSNGRAESVQSAMDYPYTFSVTDNLGMTSTMKGVIPVDVLVIREGNVLKMAVPSIIFLSDSSEFQEPQKNLTADQVAKNLQILNRIADILKKFKDYKVTVVGHANRLSDNLDEETVDNLSVWGRALMPLSKERADAIKTYLVKKGVSAGSISTDGKGGSEPVADPKDKDNNWKNRRVEFILEK